MTDMKELGLLCVVIVLFKIFTVLWPGLVKSNRYVQD